MHNLFPSYNYYGSWKALYGSSFRTDSYEMFFIKLIKKKTAFVFETMKGI